MMSAGGEVRAWLELLSQSLALWTSPHHSPFTHTPDRETQRHLVARNDEGTLGCRGSSMVRTSHLRLEVQPPFDFRAAATSHGWIALAPTAWSAERRAVQRVQQMDSGTVMLLEIAGGRTRDQPKIVVRVNSLKPLTPGERAEIRAVVGCMFRLEEDFSEFYALCQARGGLWSQLKVGGGRLLRSPTVFEDIVKTICTTNTRWSGTKRMVSQLVTTLGEPYAPDPSLRAFPTPEAIAQADSELFTEIIPLGYRGPYIHRLAQQVVSGDLDLEAFRDVSMPTQALKRKLQAIRGVGPYVTHTLLMLLGRYEELAIDSDMRAFVRQHYFEGKSPKDKEIQTVYEDWGKWRYLAYWFDPVAGS
jgi:3-methyladenine DNA glycosylase/8-oxoguanine DNA glycosylase